MLDFAILGKEAEKQPDQEMGTPVRVFTILTQQLSQWGKFFELVDFAA
jgi:hypothetical protein